APRRLQETRQDTMKGPVEPLDALEGRRDRQALAIDLLRIGDDAGNGTKPTHNPGRLGVGEVRQTPAEKLRIKFVRLAVDVEVGPGKTRSEQRRAKGEHTLEQFVNIAVFGLAQRMGIEPGSFQKGLWINA